ncbi:hypothetical protein ACR3K2_39070 [Cryptosporidium serpentis]
MDSDNFIRIDNKVYLPGDDVELDGKKQICKSNGIKCRTYYWPYNEIIIGLNGIYIPNKGDIIVGTVLNKIGDLYKISINAPYNAILHNMAFEGATKRNKPNIDIGNHICARISYSDISSGEIELTCTTPEEKRTWTSNENYLGLLGNKNIINISNNNIRKTLDNKNIQYKCIKDGIIMNIPISLTNILLSDNCYIFNIISKYFPFEICVGQNSTIWFTASTVQQLLLIMSSLKIANKCSKSEFEIIVESFWNKIKIENNNPL